ncbi:MBOAT family O-acyltransferase [Lichenibacterium dinghuense]|uniref:MBOAT family O-acyltransferase n=1 Tax=Lichenibacterium dinghuense TaxID=2895977 RepID=UPI001F413EA9|nr:MBOAT family O-acyltransferase [Lichenibacterium sp. 6Y81]
MLFNALPFLLGFLPAAVALHVLVERYRPEWRLGTLVGLSFVFYGLWDVRFAPLLAASVLFNWLAAQLFARTGWRAVVGIAIAADLLLLGVYKYLDFALSLALGAAAPGIGLALPLGISFFTFHHIMYLSDLRAGVAPRFGLARYAAYIAFFPQVLAGPLVRWREMMHQLDERPYRRPDAAARFGRGLALLTIGLAKKVLLGDGIAGAIAPVFAKVTAGAQATGAEAWHAVLGFAFQIYFDFSGYTDMALGIALLFGIVLPENFRAPYRAASLQDFWRRWHITLSRFLRDYLYIPLGGNRHGLSVEVGALFATMTLGGLWHGANLTFLAWGAGHGLGLTAGLFWRRRGWRMPAALGWALTFAFVTLLWVPFRMPTFASALSLYGSLAGLAPWGGGFRTLTLAIAAGAAMLGPVAWDAVWRMRPARLGAAALAALAALLLFKLGDGENYEFVYFQF